MWLPKEIKSEQFRKQTLVRAEGKNEVHSERGDGTQMSHTQMLDIQWCLELEVRNSRMNKWGYNQLTSGYLQLHAFEIVQFSSYFPRKKNPSKSLLIGGKHQHREILLNIGWKKIPNFFFTGKKLFHPFDTLTVLCVSLQQRCGDSPTNSLRLTISETQHQVSTKKLQTT